MTDKSPAELALEIKARQDERDKTVNEVKAIAEKAVAEAAKGIDLTNSVKEIADTLLTKSNELTSQISEMEQKLASRGGGQPVDERKSLGQMVVENEEVKARILGGAQAGKVAMSVETKALTSATGTWGSTPSVGNSLVMPDRQPMVSLPMRPMTIRDLVAPGQTSSNAIEYAVQTLRTNNAAPVAETTLKPLSAYAWDLRSFPVRTIAHIVKASRQILDDAPGLQTTIDAEMRYGLDYVEELQILNGDGSGQNLLGIIPQASAYSAAFAVTGETGIDRIRLAMLQGTLALYPMTAVVLNPTDWTKIAMQKDAQGRYLIGDPQGTIAPRLWGLPVAESLAMTAGSFLTGAFKYAAQIFDRMSVEVLISTENNDDFEKNMISVRAEERLAFVVKRPAAFVTGTLP